VSSERRLTWWSLITLILGIPIWIGVAVLGVMPRTSLDGGIFVSVVGGIRDGLPLYTGVWDNKDPLFFGVMTAASFFSPYALHALDWMWAVLGAMGTYLLAKQVTSTERALFAGIVLAPLVLLAPFHEPGLTSLPGTGMTVLGLGLALSRRGLTGGVVIGLLAFLKLIVWPIALVALVVMLLAPALRRTALRSLAGMSATLAFGVLALVALGWWGPYLDALGRNRAYASDVIVYFGYEDSPIGHLRRMVDEWAISPFGSSAWLSVVTMGAVLVLGIVVLVSRPTWRTPERVTLVIWAGIAAAGTVGILALTYVWGHHAQAIALPALFLAVVAVSLIPPRWPFPVFAVIALVVTWLVAGWGSPGGAWDRVRAAQDSWSARWATVEAQPRDATLLSTIEASEFTYARLGTNDDGGFLLSAPEGATLACPQFHLYDFSPDADFAAMLECVTGVDVVLLTDNFVVFGNGGKAPVVQPILQYVQENFECLRVDDRQVCTRRPA
jgi:hypothetical protein